MAWTRAEFLAARRAAQLADPRNRCRVLLRMVTLLDGPEPLPNPPRWRDIRVDGAHAAGEAVLRLKGAALAGRVVAGDAFGLLGRAGAQFVAAADAPCSDDDAVAVPLAAPVPAGGVAAGALVAPYWSREKRVGARVDPYPIRLVDGQMVKRTDLQVAIASHGLPLKPDPQWRVVMPDGAERTVVDATPDFVDGEPVGWTLQVR